APVDLVQSKITCHQETSIAALPPVFAVTSYNLLSGSSHLLFKARYTAPASYRSPCEWRHHPWSATLFSTRQAIPTQTSMKNSPDHSPDVVDYLLRRRFLVTRRWLRAVRQQMNIVPSGREGTRQLVNQLPHLFDELCALLRAG